MRKFWRIFALLATMAVLLSALLLTVAAENEGGNTTDIPNPGEGVEQPDDTTEQPDDTAEQPGEGNDPSGVTTAQTGNQPSGVTTAQTGSQPSGESSTSTTDTSSSAPTENTDIGGGEQPSAPIESKPTNPPVPTFAKPSSTIRTTAITTAETTTETTEATDAVIIPTSTEHPFFGSPSPEEGNKPTNNRSDHDNEEPLPIGKWVLYSILALLIMVGGGVAIHLITHTLQK